MPALNRWSTLGRGYRCPHTDETTVDRRGLPGFVQSWAGAVCSVNYLYMARVCRVRRLCATVQLVVLQSFLKARKTLLHIRCLEVSLLAWETYFKLHVPSKGNFKSLLQAMWAGTSQKESEVLKDSVNAALFSSTWLQVFISFIHKA